MSLERLDADWCKCSYIYIHNLGHWTGAGKKPRKTNLYEVLTADNVKLGEIAWFTRWRKYCFYPWGETIFEETCLREIAQFIEEETKAHRDKKKAATA